MYVPSLNFKYSCFEFSLVGHVPVGILPIFMSFVAISSMSLFLGHVACWNYTQTGPY